MTCWPPVVTSTSSPSRSMPSARHHLGDAALDDLEALGRAVLKRPRARLGGHGAHQRGVRVGRERGGVREAAGERDHVVALGERHQVAHRRGLHDLRALRKQRGVTLDVPRRGRGRGAGRDARRLHRSHGSSASLHYRHAPSRYSTVHLVFDIFQGIGIAAAVGIRPFLPALAAGALAAGNVEINFDHTDYSFLERRLSCLRWRSPPRSCSYSSGVSPPHRNGSPPAPLVYALGAVGIVLGALFFAGALAHAAITRYGPATSAVSSVRSSASSPRRPLLARVRARLDASTPARCRCSSRAPRSRSRALSVIAPPVGPIGARAAAVAAVRRPPARGPEVRGPANPPLGAAATVGRSSSSS